MFIMAATMGNPGLSSPPVTIKSESASPLSPPTSSKKDFCDENEIFGSRCKRKINFSHLGIPPRGGQQATVQRRNARERNRVKQVNNGFAALKQHIPLGHRSKKMSKVETLRCAVDYIKNLQGLLDPEGNVMAHSSSSFQAQAQKFLEAAGGHNQLSPSSSEDPSSPSYASEGSYVNSNPIYDYENYEPVSPEDEELLDAISWWQQS